jgi:hypothetical protein
VSAAPGSSVEDAEGMVGAGVKGMGVPDGSEVVTSGTLPGCPVLCEKPALSPQIVGSSVSVRGAAPSAVVLGGTDMFPERREPEVGAHSRLGLGLVVDEAG